MRPSLALMSSYEVAASIVSKAIVDVNAQKTEGPLLVDAPDTRLLGEDGVIDSLAFAFLVVTIEQYALDDLDKEIVLFDDTVMEMEVDDVDNPFVTIGTLTEFVCRKLS
jgi:acyl carrier protein